MNGNVNKSALESEINRIVEGGIKTTQGVSYKYILKTPKHTLYPPISVDHSFVRDYVDNLSDFIIVRFLMPVGDYIHHVLPYKDNLEITVIRTIGNFKTKYIYKGVITEAKGEAEDGKNTNLSMDELNSQDMHTVEMQCVDRFMYYFREATLPAIVNHKTTVNGVMTTMLNTSVSTISVAGEHMTPTLKISPPNNTRVYENVIIKSNTKAEELPFYLQNEETYGVYSSGMGMYVQDEPGSHIRKHLYVYPLFNTATGFLNRQKIIFISGGNTASQLIETTHMVEGNTVLVIVTSDSKNMDIGETGQQSSGNAMTYTDQNAVAAKNVTVTEDKVTTDARNSVVKKQHVKLDDEYLNSIDAGVIANPYKHASSVVANGGSYVKLVWRNCVTDFITPMTECQYKTMGTDNKVVVKQGVVHRVDYFQTAKEGVGSAVITMFIRNIKK